LRATVYLGVQGPTQLICAYIAFKTFFLAKSSQKFKINSQDVLFLFYDTGCSLPEEKQLFSISKKILKKMNCNLKIIHITKENYQNVLKNHKLLSCSHLFLSRNTYSYFNSFLNCNVGKNTIQICFGDGFGLFDATYWQFLTTHKGQAIKLLIKNLCEKIKNKSFLLKKFSYYCCLIPVWDKLQPAPTKKLVVASRALSLKIILNINKSIKKIRRFEEQILKNHYAPQKIYLVIPANFSGLMEQADEVKLVSDLIIKNIPEKSLILLKDHFRKPEIYIKNLKQILKFKYKVVSFNNLKYYPIELFSKICRHEKVNVLPIFSSSAWSLKYLYNKESKNCLNNNHIKTLFFKNKVLYSKLTNLVLKSVNHQIQNKIRKYFIKPKVSSDIGFGSVIMPIAFCKKIPRPIMRP